MRASSSPTTNADDDEILLANGQETFSKIPPQTSRTMYSTPEKSAVQGTLKDAPSDGYFVALVSEKKILPLFKCTH